MPTVLRDSSELIQVLENTVLPKTNCFLITPDVTSLYPNVDTKKALVALDLLLPEAQAPKTLLLSQLARLVLENSYLSSEFSSDIFHQEYGIAMGTPFAVTVTNAFMYHHEKDIVDQYSSYLTLYRRFIDDIFAIWDGPKDTLLLSLLIVLAKVTFPFWIYFCIEISHLVYCNFQLFRSLSEQMSVYTFRFVSPF